MKTTFADLATGQAFWFNGYQWVKRTASSAMSDCLRGAYRFEPTDYVTPV